MVYVQRYVLTSSVEHMSVVLFSPSSYFEGMADYFREVPKLLAPSARNIPGSGKIPQSMRSAILSDPRYTDPQVLVELL